MIYNERQYKITGKQIKNLNQSLASMQKITDPDFLLDAQIEAMLSQIRELKSQIIEYDLIKQGGVHFSECSDLTFLPKILIQSRIAKGMSQKELGEALGLTAQQVQRYEASSYMGASLSRLIEVSEILEVTIKAAWGEGKMKSHTAVDEINDIKCNVD